MIGPKKSYKLIYFLPALLVFTFCLSCGQPVLESAGCIAAREPVKRLYALHVYGGPQPSGKQLEKIGKFLSEQLLRKLTDGKESKGDYLTQSENFPKAYRVGACRDTANGTELDVLLIWRTNEVNMEKTLKVTAVKEEAWVVDSVRMEKQ